MIVWGGYDGTRYLKDGARFSPTANSWTPLTANVPLSARWYHTAIWTGAEMILWGGYNTSDLNDGARYSPAVNTWTSMPTIGAPTARSEQTAIWTGTEMILWGGFNRISYLNDGGRYNPVSNSWVPLPGTLPNAPVARYLHTAVWSGTEMIICGGFSNGGNSLDDWGRYNPVANTWAAPSTTGTPTARRLHSAVWTGTEMLVWGGANASGYLNDTWSYTPGKTMYLYQKP
jgi:N-acetylneuraminic acid mutarotase